MGAPLVKKILGELYSEPDFNASLRTRPKKIDGILNIPKTGYVGSPASPLLRLAFFIGARRISLK
jgi:hypothetical protein